MKPIYYRKYSTPFDNSFFVHYAEVQHTYNQFHHHKEFEILYNIVNSGTRFVGDSIHRFTHGDLVLVGPYIPHYWHSDNQFFEGKLKAKVVLIQFEDNFLGDQFISRPEVKNIKELFVKADHGIHFMGNDAITIGTKIIQLPKETGWKKLLLMIEILCLMGEAKEYELLSSRGFTEASKYDSQERISKLFNFIVSNHNRDLKLKEAANFTNMNPSAFCRYLKKSTSRTFSEILNEIRIGFACKSMINTDKSISEIAFECGFMNIPYFNRQFKKIKGMSPLEYRKKH
jgi:AraC-like DNA-binding protein